MGKDSKIIMERLLARRELVEYATHCPDVGLVVIDRLSAHNQEFRCPIAGGPISQGCSDIPYRRAFAGEPKICELPYRIIARIKDFGRQRDM